MRVALPPMLRSCRLHRKTAAILLTLLLVNVGCKKKASETSAAFSDPNEVRVTSAIAPSLKLGTPEVRMVTGTL